MTDPLMVAGPWGIGRIADSGMPTPPPRDEQQQLDDDIEGLLGLTSTGS